MWFELIFSLAGLGFAGVPVAIGFAVLKYRLYDIDVVINLTLVYGSLTAALVAVYFGGVATTQTILRAFTGQTEQPQLAIVVSTLVIAALFNPLRRRIQSFIDRRFYRSKYDARKTLEAFSARLRDETDLETLNNNLAGVIRETMQPLTSRCGCVPPGTRRASRRFGSVLSCWMPPGPGNRLVLDPEALPCASGFCRMVTDLCSARSR